MSNNTKDTIESMAIKTMDKNDILSELLNKQIKNIPNDKKLQYIDLKRVCKFIPTTIFDDNQCCLWNSYVTNQNSNNKGLYINFYFRQKKAALHRLLYSNFVGELDTDEYLKFTCENKGKCCTVSHLNKYKYNKKTDDTTVKTKVNKKNKINKETKINNSIVVDKEELQITFDL